MNNYLYIILLGLFGMATPWPTHFHAKLYTHTKPRDSTHPKPYFVYDTINTPVVIDYSVGIIKIGDSMYKFDEVSDCPPQYSCNDSEKVFQINIGTEEWRAMYLDRRYILPYGYRLHYMRSGLKFTPPVQGAIATARWDLSPDK